MSTGSTGGASWGCLAWCATLGRLRSDPVRHIEPLHPWSSSIPQSILNLVGGMAIPWFGPIANSSAPTGTERNRKQIFLTFRSFADVSNHLGSCQLVGKYHCMHLHPCGRLHTLGGIAVRLEEGGRFPPNPTRQPETRICDILLL